jgi:hypothetical protein
LKMKRSKTSLPYVTVPKLRVKAKKPRYEESSTVDNIGNVATSNFGKPKKSLLLNLADDEELISEESIEESIDNENEKQDSTDEDSTYEKSENSPERINEVIIIILYKLKTIIVIKLTFYYKLF